MSKSAGIFPLLAGAAMIWFGRPDHLLIWAGTFCAISGIGVLMGWIIFRRKKMSVVADGRGQYHLLPMWTRQERLASLGIPSLTAVVAGTVLLARTRMPGKSMPGEDQALVGLDSIFACGLVALVFYSLWTARRFTQPQVLLMTGRPKLDEPVTLRVEFSAKRSMRLDQCLARFRCFEYQLLHMGRYTQLSIRMIGEEIGKLGENIELSPVKSFSNSATILLDSAKHRATGRKEILTYPHFVWEIWVEVNGAGSSTTVFPIVVDAKVAAASG
jgi:hypothetical protein